MNIQRHTAVNFI